MTSNAELFNAAFPESDLSLEVTLDKEKQENVLNLVAEKVRLNIQWCNGKDKEGKKDDRLESDIAFFALRCSQEISLLEEGAPRPSYKEQGCKLRFTPLYTQFRAVDNNEYTEPTLILDQIVEIDDCRTEISTFPIVWSKAGRMQPAYDNRIDPNLSEEDIWNIFEENEDCPIIEKDGESAYGKISLEYNPDDPRYELIKKLYDADIEKSVPRKVEKLVQRFFFSTRVTSDVEDAARRTKNIVEMDIDGRKFVFCITPDHLSNYLKDVRAEDLMNNPKVCDRLEVKEGTSFEDVKKMKLDREPVEKPFFVEIDGDVRFYFPMYVNI